MKVKDFKKLINRGFGEAIVFLRKNPNLIHKYYNAILFASTHNTAYDRQCEWSRENYLFEIIMLSDKKELLENEVIKALYKSSDSYSTDQLLKLCKNFAENGNDLARNAIYHKFDETLKSNDGYFGSDEIIHLDGMNGFLYIAKAVGQRIISDENYIEEDWLLDSVSKKYGKRETTRILKEESKNQKSIKAYLEAVKKYKKSKKENSFSKRQGIDEIREVIKNYKKGDGNFIFRRWGREATQDELDVIANDFINEKNQDMFIPYLNIFMIPDFPKVLNKVIEIARINDEELSLIAFRVLRKIKSKEIHDLAIELIKREM
ncbi:MAG: hypothetical protein N2645_22665 [Clostridia bacterium]|nr:hypothetical protein [Clostridia bacterium]